MYKVPMWKLDAMSSTFFTGPYEGLSSTVYIE